MLKSFLCGVALLAMGTESGAQALDAGQAKPPAKIVPKVDLRPAQPPGTALQQVAVLSIVLDAVRGEVRSAQVRSAKRIASYAPKVFTRQGGDWEVLIEGERPRRFFVANPALREAEAHPSSNNRYQWVGETGVIDWPLVVPLYADGRSLGARSITIRDTRSHAVILRTDL